MHALEQHTSMVVEEDTTIAPLEQGRAQLFLDRAHRTADGAMGQMQLIGRAAEALQPGRCFKAAQRKQRRQALGTDLGWNCLNL